MLSKTRILIVEDELAIVTDIRTRLEKMGSQVCSIVPSGLEAIQQAEELRPDIVLMDIVLEGDMDGIEAAQEIRSRFDIPIIYLTSHAHDEILERVKITEPYGYIVKPVETAELKAAIHVALYKHGIDKKLRQEIIQRKMAQEALLDSKEFTNRVIDNSRECIRALDLNENLSSISSGGQNPMEADDIPRYLHRLCIENRSLVESLKLANEDQERKVEERTWKLQRANIELSALNAIATTVNQSFDKTKMVEMVVKRVCEVLSVPRCSIILFDEKKQEGTIHGGYDELNFPGHGVGEKIVLSRQPPLQEIVKTRDPIIIEDATEDGRTSYMQQLVARYKIKRIAFMPLIYRDDIIGVMVMDRLADDPPFTNNEIHLAMTMAEQITVGVKNALLYDQVKRQLEMLEEHDRELKSYATVLQKKVDERVSEVRRMDRLSALGELSAAIAHEIRNPLTGISSNAQLLRDNVGDNISDDELLTEATENILIGVNRIEKIIADILDFANPKHATLTKCSLYDIVAQTARLTDPQCKQKKIELEVQCEENLPLLLLDRMQIEQVLINLVLNALHATSPGGSISLNLSNYREPADRGDGDKLFVLLSIADTGVGMSPDMAEKIFDPFFTTKPDGTGLGLSISYAILKEHNVDIQVNSELGKGTTFFLKFPVSNS
ncbi:MAG: response regulator [Deltaproteobacteria bacterium]|nr:response regulator [Deltaproteobacteria bacterium]